MRGAEGTTGSGFRLVEDAVRDDYNDYDDYECLAVSASLLPTDRINLTFWRRHFILTVIVPKLSFTTLNAVSKQQEKRDGLGALEYTEGRIGGPGVHRASESFIFSHWCLSSFAADAHLRIADRIIQQRNYKKLCVILCVLRYWYSDRATDRKIRG